MGNRITKINGVPVLNTKVEALEFENNELKITQSDKSSYTVEINNFDGLTVNGSVSATTYYGDGSNLIGISAEDNYVTGGTFSSSTLTLNRQNGSVVITGFTSTDYYVTGGTYNVDTDILTLNRQDDSVNINITPKPAINLFNYYNLY